MNRLAAILIGVALLAAPSHAAEGFEKAHAILQEHCFKCHSHAEKKSKGGLMLDSQSSLLEGGDSGPAISTDKPAEGLLLKAISHADPDLQMPPKTKLSDAQIATLTAWIQAGAPWPESEGAKVVGAKLRKKGEFTEAERQWWAFQPVKKVVPPEVKSSAVIHNDVDRFINARLEAERLQPAGEASRSALIRRVTFDLTGLPPTPSEVKEFLADTRSDAYERLVDRLLESPRYGERMARYWLDLVRYADGDGYRADDFRPHAWRYRDYVIASCNSDKPYTRFIQEQLAGDEMFPDDPDAVIATGYLRHGIYEWNARDVRGQWETILNDLTDTTGDVFFGLGLQCARCHDHKFDPILQKDYFRLQAFFAPIQLEDRIAACEAEALAHAERTKVWEEKTATIRAELAALEKPYLDKAEKIAVNRFPEDIQKMIRKPVAERSPFEHQLATLSWRQVIYDWERLDRTFKAEDKDRILSLRRALAAFEKEKPEPLPTAFAAKDVGPEAPPVFVPKKKGLGAIEPGILTLLNPAPMKAEALPNSTGRRTALAQWLTDPANPLTARVFVNRAWQQRFGRGLAANSSDFGTLGEKPTHPELLDWLAAKFVEEGWSMKKLNRLLVTSAAYRRSSEQPNAEPGKLKDPENRLWWRWTPRRLEAEQIRDSMLAVSGQL
ncbi:MAG: PSD1 and planctomycete cytochrome C domain-containing protein, partial [Limisphaerales bacterium]